MEYILPIAILILAFILKLFIDRSVEATVFIQALYELPVDIVFLALSFLAAHTISITENQEKALLFCFVLTIIATLNVIVLRRALKLLDKKSIKWSIALTALNYFSTIFILYEVITRFLTLK
jgi:hypothetical protein